MRLLCLRSRWREGPYRQICQDRRRDVVPLRRDTRRRRMVAPQTLQAPMALSTAVPTMVPTAELMAEPRQTPLRPAERVCKPPALYQKPPSLPEAAIFHERHSMPGTRHKYDDNPVGMPQRL